MKKAMSINEWNEFDRQCEERNVPFDSNTPIKSGETLEPSIRGCKKIEEDEDLKTLLRMVYRGEC